MEVPWKPFRAKQRAAPSRICRRRASRCAWETLQQQLEQRGDAFEIHRFGGEAAARTAIEDRVVYGAVVITSKGPQLLTASAASPMVAQLLREAVTTQALAGSQVQVTDVVAAPAGDPRGSTLGASILPPAIAGVAAGSAVTMLRLRGGRAAGALIGVAALVGIAAAALTGSWLGAITGDWWTEAGSLGLTVLAIGATVAGLAALIGPSGVGLGALLMVLLGNPFSGITSAPEPLPRPVGAIGQLLPPGAGGSLLRSVAFFDGSAAGDAVRVLNLWAVVGPTAVLVGGRRRPPAATTPAPSAPESALAG
ncbi:ABC transporter permease [Streptomyces sp. NPDC055681]